MSLSAEQFAPADKIKFHTSVQCQLPLPWVFILMTILIAGDGNEPDLDIVSQLWWTAPQLDDDDIISLTRNYPFWSDFSKLIIQERM